MADNTPIEWCDATVNAINGCTVLSPGCTNCYAMRLAGTRLKHHESRSGLTIDTKAGPVWNGEVRLSEKALLQPLRWKRPRMIFWNAHGDTFHEKVPDEWIDLCMAVAALTPQHIHQFLTKRSDRMREYFSQPHKRADILDAASHLSDDWKVQARGVWHAETWPFPNVWLGVSVEDRARMLERAADLIETPAAVRWWSAEPLLGDLGEIPPHLMPEWIVLGGESGPGARPMHPDWARSVRDQCEAAGVPFHFKQWGNWSIDTWSAPDVAVSTVRGRISMYPDGTYMGRGFFPEGSQGLTHLRCVGKKAAGRLLDGVEHNGLPGRIAA